MTPAEIETLKKARELIKTYIDDCGGCDHSVGICFCEDERTVRELDEIIKKNTP